jgi:hypothetical protein
MSPLLKNKLEPNDYCTRETRSSNDHRSATRASHVQAKNNLNRFLPIAIAAPAVAIKADVTLRYLSSPQAIKVNIALHNLCHCVAPSS